MKEKTKEPQFLSLLTFVFFRMSSGSAEADLYESPQQAGQQLSSRIHLHSTLMTGVVRRTGHRGRETERVKADSFAPSRKTIKPLSAILNHKTSSAHVA